MSHTLRPATRWLYAILYLGYIILSLALRWGGRLGVDYVWYVDAARHLLAGSWRIYEFFPANSIPVAPPLGTAYAYSPLPALLMAPFVALADALGDTPLAASVGGGDQLAYRLVALPLLVADVLAMDQVRRLARAWRPQVDEAALFLGVLVSLLLTSFLEVSAIYNHQEGLVLLLLLLSIQVTPRHPAWGGVLAGLTLAAKQTAVLILLPVALALLTTEGRRQKAEGRNEEFKTPNSILPTAYYLLPTIAWAGLAAATFGAWLLPAWLANPAAVVYVFLTQEERRVLFDPALPGWLDAALADGLRHGTPEFRFWHFAILRYSNLVLLGVGAALTGLVYWRAARRGRPIGFTDSRLLALIAGCGLVQIIFAKWIGSHYYQLPLALLLLWDTVRRAPGLPWLGLGAALSFKAISLLAPGPNPPFPYHGAYVVVLFIALAAAVFAVAWRDPPLPPPEAALEEIGPQ